ncbi:hypothetical protein GUG51_23630, partial [Xanthomonas citri pv. citri]|nr:hypothetical protein [Xanthomonas citri pv. citri]
LDGLRLGFSLMIAIERLALLSRLASPLLLTVVALIGLTGLFLTCLTCFLAAALGLTTFLLTASSLVGLLFGRLTLTGFL